MDKKTHLYDAERSERFSRLIIARCGHVGTATRNIEHVTCKRCLRSASCD